MTVVACSSCGADVSHCTCGGDRARPFVDPAEIVEQRAKGWPDFHPETYCHRCGRLNVRSWHVGSAEWNRAFPDGVLTIACPTCFTEAWERATGQAVTWVLRIDPLSVHG